LWILAAPRGGGRRLLLRMDNWITAARADRARADDV
jgi:hypothetical protein